MNRAERRRQQRAEARNRTPVLIAGEGIVAAGLGQHFEARPSRDLGPKVAGRHRFVASGVWVMGDDIDADAVMDADRMKFLDNENLMMLAVWCWDCEEPAQKAGPTCPAEGND